MSYQKRNRKRRRNRRKNQQVYVIKPRCLCVFASGLENQARGEMVRRLKAEFQRYDQQFTTFANTSQQCAMLTLLPGVIVLVCRLQDMDYLARFHMLLEAVKRQITGYFPDVQIWEIKPDKDAIPAMDLTPVPDIRYNDPVIADIQRNRSQRNLLN